MTKTPNSSGILFCTIFLVTEAVRAVYFGGVFQEASSFVVGALVFGAISSVLLCYIFITDRMQFTQVWSVRWLVIKVNILTAASWTMYFFAIQLVEPAVIFTVFSGVILITMLLAAQFDVIDEPIDRGIIVWTGYIGIMLAVLYLAVITLAGKAGFVRGSTVMAGLGLTLAVGASVLIALAMIICKQLDASGIKPLTQLGTRFILYVFVALLLGTLGFDKKDELSSEQLFQIVCFGILLTALAGYSVQKAVSLVSSQAIGVASAFGPCLVFGLQLVEGRVDFTFFTLIGVSCYCASALLVSLGSIKIRHESNAVGIDNKR